MTVCFGLFTTFGGAMAGGLTLVAGMVTYLAASWGSFAYPFLLSLGISLATYVVTAFAERAVHRFRHA